VLCGRLSILFSGYMDEESNGVIRILAVTSEIAVFLLLRHVSMGLAKNYNKYKHRKLLVYKQTCQRQYAGSSTLKK